MARNHRRVDGEMTFSWIIPRLFLLVLVVGLLLGGVFLKQRPLKLGDELRALDRELKQLQEQNACLEAQITRYKTPRELEVKVARWHLGMVQPVENQIRRLPEPDLNGESRARLMVQADNSHHSFRTP